MAWERRERGGVYYTRSKKVGGRVVRQYIGGGPLGKIAALEDEYQRRRREEDAAYWKEETERLEQDAAFLQELEAVSKILATAHLLAADYHRHKGQWRLLRERA